MFYLLLYLSFSDIIFTISKNNLNILAVSLIQISLLDINFFIVI